MYNLVGENSDGNHAYKNIFNHLGLVLNSSISRDRDLFVDLILEDFVLRVTLLPES